jgi:peroxiredoxin
MYCIFELVGLDGLSPELQNRQVRIIAISHDDYEETQGSQNSFPHLAFVADSAGKMARALAVDCPVAGPGSRETNAPTTMLVDGGGIVRWIFRPERYDVRLSPEEVFRAVGQFLLGSPM